jgi:hypothetical protein
MISIHAYKEVMRAFAAFDGTDINHDNNISAEEVRFLLYAFEGDDPDELRIYNEMR